jgi:hypothetical protein
MGPEAYVITCLGGGEVTARISAGVKALTDSMLPLHFDATQASCFDPVTGDRIDEKVPLARTEAAGGY